MDRILLVLKELVLKELVLKELVLKDKLVLGDRQFGSRAERTSLGKP